MNTRNMTALLFGQRVIELGLKIQKREIPLSFVLRNIDKDFVVSAVNDDEDWASDITPSDRIKALMELQELSKSDLAKALSVSRQYISAVLNGKKPLSLDLARKIAKVLGCPLSGIVA